MCLPVHMHIAGTTRAMFLNFSVHVAYDRGSVLFRQGDEIPRERGSFRGFSSPLTMHCKAFAAKGIIHIGKGVMGVHSHGSLDKVTYLEGCGVAQRGRSVIYV